MTDTQSDLRGWIGQTAVDQSGDKIGKVEEIYVDDVTGEPEWLAIKTGLFGSKLTFAPLRGATSEGDDLRLPYAKDLVKDAPNVETDGHLEPDEEALLYRHYGRTDYDVATDQANDSAGPGTVGEDTSGPETDDAMTRSEEELRVDKVKRETGSARLRKFIVTDVVEMSVPVQREEVRVVREPITEANRDQAMAGGDLTTEEHEVTLHEEQVVVDKQVVPKERVRLDTDVVTDERQVSEEVRKEQIEVDGDVDHGQRDSTAPRVEKGGYRVPGARPSARRVDRLVVDGLDGLKWLGQSTTHAASEHQGDNHGSSRATSPDAHNRFRRRCARRLRRGRHHCGDRRCRQCEVRASDH